VHYDMATTQDTYDAVIDKFPVRFGPAPTSAV
jgi:hypothetical protein